MADVLFSSYAFKASPATATLLARTMPDRLGKDFVNVLDFGADPTGVADSTAAIQAAIDYAYSLKPWPNGGATVFLPRGRYLVSATIQLNGSGAGHFGGDLHLVGAGRDATVVTGNIFDVNPPSVTNYSAGFILRKADAGDNASLVKDMTIWNTSILKQSGCIFSFNSDTFRVHGCRLIGMIGVDFNTSFEATLIDNIFRCSAPVARADSSSPGAAAGSVGAYVSGCAVLNNRFEGFDIGIAVGAVAMTSILNNYCYRCNEGLRAGRTDPHWSDSAGPLNVCYAMACHANHFERCGSGINIFNANGFLIAGNLIDGTDGVCDPAPISGMTWNNVSHVVTVSTATAHNISAGTHPLQIITSNPAWTPDNSGDQILTCTQSNSTQFTYPGPTSDPGSFTGGSWNYALEAAIIVNITAFGCFAANDLSARAGHASFDPWNYGKGGPGSNGKGGSVAMAMDAPYGWGMNFVPYGTGGPASWEFINCIGSENPNMYLHYADLGTNFRWEGREFNVIDAQSQTRVLGVVPGGGSTNRYKVRYDGKNWLRIG